MFENIQKRIETRLRSALSVIPPSSLAFANFANHVSEFAKRPGGRWRPLLCVVSGESLGCKDVNSLESLAVAIELMHTMALVHDDLIDGAHERRNGPSLNQVLTEIGPGEDLALLAGDHLLIQALEIVNLLPFDASLRQRILNTLLAGAKSAINGAVQEIIMTGQPLAAFDKQDILTMYRLKTAEYSIVCPLVAGALAASASDHAISTLVKIGQLLGVAYQIRDDLDELRTPQSDDIRDCRPTLLLWHAWHIFADTDQAVDLRQAIASRSSGDDKIHHALWLLLNRNEVLEAGREDLKQHCRRAIDLLAEEKTLPTQLSMALMALTGHIGGV